MPAATLQEASVDQVHAWLRSGDADLFDVRRESEWKAAHIEGAEWLPLDSLNQNLPMLAKDRRIAVHCKSGYRSAIACSVLQRAGFQNVVNVLGGIDDWQAANLPTISEETVKV